MSNTEKDRPYRVRAKDASKGVKKHSGYCGRPSRSGSYVRTVEHVFYAHQVKEMEALRIAVEEAGDTLKITEKAGYAVVYDPNSDFFHITNPHKSREPLIFEKVVHAQRGQLGDARHYTGYNIFYIYEVTHVRHWKGTDECCGFELPRSMDGAKGCSCCSGEDRRLANRTEVRDNLMQERKSANTQF